ncbi:MAG: S9 family peptidase, partial [Gammaproteobacteria bacterium]|nr:S9 family peptidase [Gammaproteobacteria bacterium]
MQNGDTRQISLMNYTWFPNQSELLLLNEGDIWHYQLNEEKLIRLTNTEAVEEEADISPKGKSVSFIRENDLYVMNLDTGEERQLTTEGSETILNGKLDWVYQEELVGRGIFRGYFWSPKSDKIAYLRFDTSNIPEYPLVDWRPYHPEVENMRYPKAGDPNSTVKLGVVSIDNSETVWMDTGEEKAVYFPRVYWLPDGKTVAFMRLDRLQQHLELLFADANTGESRVILEERDPYWINLGDYVHFFKNKDRFLWGSERSGYNHLYLYNYEGKVVKQLTGGEWLVDKLAGVNEIDGWIYFTATKKDLRERHVYRVNTGGDKFERISDRCGVHEIKMAATGKFYADKFSSTERPSEVTLHRGSGDLLETIVGDDQNLPRKFAISEPEFLTFTGDKGITYYARIIKPPDFDPGKKYPMLIYTYGGPHGQVVQNKFGGLSQKWHLMLAQRGYIIFSMDNRG